MFRFEALDGMQWLGIGVGAGGGISATLVGAWPIGLVVLLSGLLLAVIREGASDRPPSHRHRIARTDGGEPGIDMVTAVIRPGKINAVKQALAAAGAPSLTVTNVSGRGTQPTETGQWRGEEYIVDLHQKVKVEVVVPDEKTDAVIGAIQEAAHTGEPGDGKIWVLPITDAIRVSTEERGADAI